MALSVAHRIFSGHRGDVDTDDLVYHVECATRRAGQPDSHHEPGQSPLVFFGITGDVGLF
jgi:hypothetical protein